jgi:hypothetical protein
MICQCMAKLVFIVNRIQFNECDSDARMSVWALLLPSRNFVRNCILEAWICSRIMSSLGVLFQSESLT